jgi:hypothetical protein
MKSLIEHKLGLYKKKTEAQRERKVERGNMTPRKEGYRKRERHTQDYKYKYKKRERERERERERSGEPAPKASPVGKRIIDLR